MVELPRPLPEFEARFPDEAACARWLLAKRWPDGFRCPACGHAGAWELGRERLTLQCAACERQVSVTAGTALRQPPAAAHLVPGRLAGGDAQERDVGSPTVAAAGPGQLQVGVAAAPRAAPGASRPDPDGRTAASCSSPARSRSGVSGRAGSGSR